VAVTNCRMCKLGMSVVGIAFFAAAQAPLQQAA
jgi:hypothetical protein